MKNNSCNLTFKQRKFANEYLFNGGNGQQAALKTYATQNLNTARAIASENLTKLNVQKYIEEKLSSQDISVDKVLGNLCLLTESDNEAVQLKANELLGKHLKMFTDKIDHTHVLEGVKSIGWASPCENTLCVCKCHGNRNEKYLNTITR